MESGGSEGVVWRSEGGVWRVGEVRGAVKRAEIITYTGTASMLIAGIW